LNSGFDKELLEIYAELDRDRLMDLVVKYARDRVHAGGSSIFLRDDITGRYVLRSTTGLRGGDKMPSERIEYEPGEGLTGWIAEHGRSLRIANPMDDQELKRIADDLTWSKKYSEVSAMPGLAYLGGPILSPDASTVLGVLRVSGKGEGEAFRSRDEVLLCHVAAMVHIAIENSQRYEREKRRARYFRLLLDISSELDPRRPIGEMLQAVTEQVRQGFRTEGCLIYLQAEEDVHRVVLRAVSGLPQSLVGEITYMTGEGLTGHIVHSGQPIQIREDAEANGWEDTSLDRIAVHLPSQRYRSFIGVPLRLGEETLGTLELVNKIPSSPGHRDWFTDDDQEYLMLLSTAIGGVLEGARYLKALNDVGVTAMRMQRVASFGSLAQRIRHEASNPLAVARLAATNLRGDLQGLSVSPSNHEMHLSPEETTRLNRRMDVIDRSLNDVSSKLLDLLKFSQRIGFVPKQTQWNDVVREVLIWLAGERQRRGVEIHTGYAELPPLFIEPNELFGVLVTVLHLAMETLGPEGGLIEVQTASLESRMGVQTRVTVPHAPQSDKIPNIIEPAAGAPEEISPLHFEWGLAQDTVRTQYEGRLIWQVQGEKVTFSLELPI
jgi:GAF domain-containing protein